MSLEFYWYRFKNDPLKWVFPALFFLWSIYCVVELANARTVLEAVRWGSFSIINAIHRRSKK